MLTGCAEFEEPIAHNFLEEEKEGSILTPQTRASVAYQVNPDNPYALNNVQTGLDIVIGPNAPTLQPTHKYIRLLPQSEADVDVLMEHLGLDLYPYPLDHDLTLAEMEAYENTLINGYA